MRTTYLEAMFFVSGAISSAFKHLLYDPWRLSVARYALQCIDAANTSDVISAVAAAWDAPVFSLSFRLSPKRFLSSPTALLITDSNSCRSLRQER